MTVDQAKVVAIACLNARPLGNHGRLMIDDRWTVETEAGFVFFYQHRDWVEYHDESAKVTGNYPIFVDKFSEAPRFMTLVEYRNLDARLRRGELTPLSGKKWIDGE